MKKFGGLFLLIALSAITHWQWLVLPGIFTSGDYWYIPSQIFSESTTSPRILEAATSLASGISQPTFVLLNFFGGLLTKIHLDFSVWERVLFLWPIALLAPIPIYLLLLKTLRYPAGAFAGSAIYVFNTYILAREMMHLHIVIVYFLAPLLFLALRDLLHKQTVRSIFFFIAVTGVASIFEIRILYILTFILITYAAYLLASRRIAFSWSMVRTIAFAIVPLTLLQSYWLIPFLFTNSSLGYESIVNRGLFRSYDHIAEAITLSDPFWSGGQLTNFIPQLIPRWEYIVPIVAFMWIIIRPRMKKNLFFWYWSAIAIIGIFLVKQENNPLPHVYTWLFYHFPGFNFFRESSKLKIIIAIAFSMLTAGSLLLLRSRFNKIANALVLGISVIMIMHSIPLATGDIQAMTVPYSIQNSFTVANNTINEDTSFGRTLWIPSAERFITASQLHPRLSLATLAGNTWAPFVPDQTNPFSIASSNAFKALLNFASIRYIGEPSDQIDNVFQLYNVSKAGLGTVIANTPGLTPAPWAPTSMPIWLNQNAKEHAYISDNVVAVHGALQDYSGSDPSAHTAFVFQATTPEDVFQRIKDTIATNKEYIPFTSSSIAVQQGAVTTKEKVPQVDGLQTITKQGAQDIIAPISITISDPAISVIAKLPNRDIILASAPNTHQDYAVIINGKNYFYTYDENTAETAIGTARLHSSSNAIELLAKNNSDQILKNPSFEDGTWGDAGDCNNSDGTNTQANLIKSSLSDVATDGQHSLLLTAGKHIACTKNTIASATTPTTHFGSIDYRLENGNAGYMKIFESDPMKEVASVQFNTRTEWQHANFSFTTQQPQELSIYLYQPSNNGDAAPSAGLFDNIHINAYQSVLSTTTFVNEEPVSAPSSKPYQVEDITISNPNINGANILQQANIASEPILQPGDCNNADGSSVEKNGIKSSIGETPDHGQILSVQAKKHIACIVIPLTNFDPTFDYLLSITYRTITGDGVYATLYPNDSSPKATVQLQKTGGAWQTKNTIIPGDGISLDARFILYVPTDSGPAESQFAAISLVRIPILPQRFIQTTNPSLSDIPTIEQDFGSTMRVLHVDDIGTATRMLVLSDQFNKNWRVFVRQKNTANQNIIQRALFVPPGIEIASDSHIKVNGFTNGWIIDPQEIQEKFGSTQNLDLVIEYWPQRFMDSGAIVSIITFVLCVGIMITLLFLVRYERA